MGWEKELVALAGNLPAGMPDLRAADKLRAEWKELNDAIASGSAMAEVAAEAADCLYYAVKAKYSALDVDVTAELKKISAAAHLGSRAIVEAALTKYRMRAAPGNPKDVAAENAAIERALTARWEGSGDKKCVIGLT